MDEDVKQTYKAQMMEGVQLAFNLSESFMMIDNEKEQIAALDSQLHILQRVDEQLGIAKEFMMHLFSDPTSNWGTLVAGTANTYINKTKKRTLASFLYCHMLAYYLENKTSDDRYFKAAQLAITSAAATNPKIMSSVLLGAVESVLSQDGDSDEVYFDIVHDDKFMANLKRLLDTVQSLGVKFDKPMTERWTDKKHDSFWDYIYSIYDIEQIQDYKIFVEFLEPYGKAQARKISAKRCLVVA
jgi:hypothetical protein